MNQTREGLLYTGQQSLLKEATLKVKRQIE